MYIEDLEQADVKLVDVLLEGLEDKLSEVGKFSVSKSISIPLTWSFDFSKCVATDAGNMTMHMDIWYGDTIVGNAKTTVRNKVKLDSPIKTILTTCQSKVMDALSSSNSVKKISRKMDMQTVEELADFLLLLMKDTYCTLDNEVFRSISKSVTTSFTDADLDLFKRATDKTLEEKYRRNEVLFYRDADGAALQGSYLDIVFSKTADGTYTLDRLDSTQGILDRLELAKSLGLKTN